MERNRKDWWDNLQEAERKDIEIGIKQADKSMYIDDRTVMQKFKKFK